MWDPAPNVSQELQRNCDLGEGTLVTTRPAPSDGGTRPHCTGEPAGAQVATQKPGGAESRAVNAVFQAKFTWGVGEFLCQAVEELWPAS
jgi:hypothetical protein